MTKLSKNSTFNRENYYLKFVIYQLGQTFRFFIVFTNKRLPFPLSNDQEITFGRINHQCKILLCGRHVAPVSRVIYTTVFRPFLLFIFSFGSRFLLFTGTHSRISPVHRSISRMRKLVPLHSRDSGMRRIHSTIFFSHLSYSKRAIR